MLCCVSFLVFGSFLYLALSACCRQLRLIHFAIVFFSAALMSYWLLALFLQRMNYGRIAQIALRKGQRKQIAFMLCFEIAFLVFACFSVQINKNVVIFDQIYIAMICIPAVRKLSVSFVSFCMFCCVSVSCFHCRPLCVACCSVVVRDCVLGASPQHGADHRGTTTQTQTRGSLFLCILAALICSHSVQARPATIQVVSQGGGAKQPQSRSAPAAPNAAVVQAPVPSPAQPTSRKLSQTADRALTPNSEPRQLALPGQVLAEREHRESASQPMQPLLAENRNTSTDASASLMAAGTPKSAPAQSPAVAANAQVNAAVKSPTQSPQQQTGALAINVNVNANTNVRKSVASAPPPAVSSVPAQEPRRIAGMRVLVWLGLNSALFGIVTTAIVVWGLTPIPAGKLVANFITLRVLSWWWMFTTMLMYWPKKDDDE